MLGLAPAAHGANRTGRVFTGDGRGGSGDFLMGGLHRAGLASIPTSQHPGDGLTLRGMFVAAAARCAPPANKPLPHEAANCRVHLAAEVAALPRPRPVFSHGAVAQLAPAGTTTPARLTLIGAFHPSRQNTHTGRVTSAMYDEVFALASRLA